jgi:hypothetical protein
VIAAEQLADEAFADFLAEIANRRHHSLNGPDQWRFAPLILAGAYGAIVLVLAYYLMGM